MHCKNIAIGIPVFTIPVYRKFPNTTQMTHGQ